MQKFSLGKPVYIDGQEVVVVRDVVGTPGASGKDSEVFSIVEHKGSDGRPPIYVAENELARLREHYPGINVYGLWQILFYNRAVKLGAQVITFPLNDTGGMYLIMENGGDLHDPSRIAQSGEYIDNFIVDFIDFDLDKASRIDVDLTTLRLPPQPAYTRLELSDKIRAENNRRWMVVGGLCAMFMVAALATNYGLSTIHKSRMADYATKRGLIDELTARIESLSSERLVQRPDDSGTLAQLFRIFEISPDAWTLTGGEVVVGFKSVHKLITGPNAKVDPALLVKGVTSQLQPDLSYQIDIDPLAAGESASLVSGGQ